ncbi:hypothetical protein ABPG72_013615, partial [Tetrahymena utriculariae]
ISFAQFSQNCTQLKCKECSSDDQFSCLGCQFRYLFDQISQQYVFSYANRTYQNLQNNCTPSSIKNCVNCQSNYCLECEPGFTLKDSKNICVSNCDNGQYMLKRQSTFYCDQQQNGYTVNFQSKTCQKSQTCPNLQFNTPSQDIQNIKFKRVLRALCYQKIN